MDLGLKERVALVSGGSRGIGRAIARALAAEGCRVAICARTQAEVEKAADEIRAATGSEVVPFTVDLTHRSATQRFADGALEAFGRIDVLVNNVGGNLRKPFEETTDEDWDELLELNLLASLRLTRCVLPVMKRSGYGSIIFVSSVWGREAGGPGMSIYHTTKTAVISAAKVLALELAPVGIRVNSVAPGSIRFPGGSWDRRARDDPDKVAKFVADNMPLGRFGSAEEVAALVAFLASERASLITGACIPADGGQGKSMI
ncbi:MAG: SDR family oxidoreductase [Gemmatimonadetes bacterium]|nr:SDR family oxidoreductase [Gemmatimonadota bacterium]